METLKQELDRLIIEEQELTKKVIEESKDWPYSRIQEVSRQLIKMRNRIEEIRASKAIL